MEKCPACGYTEVKTLKKFTHDMAEYVYEDGNHAGIFNSNEKSLMIQPKGAEKQIKLVRKDLYVVPVATKPATTDKPKA